MPTFKLDGREIPFEQGDTIIRAAAPRRGSTSRTTAGTPASRSRPTAACAWSRSRRRPGSAAMHARHPRVGRREERLRAVARSRSSSRRARSPSPRTWRCKSDSSDRGRQGALDVQEFLLLNHPVDCPICDQAGECKLQDYWLEHQGTKKRMRDEPVHKPKAVVFGPTIVYDAERCIVCTRCVRFCDEVAKDPVLDMRERGNLNEIVVSPGPPARPRLHADDRARVPGRRAHQHGLPLQGARLVPPLAHAPSARAARPAATRTSTTIRAQRRRTATARATTWRSTSTGCATRACSRTRGSSRIACSSRR